MYVHTKGSKINVLRKERELLFTNLVDLILKPRGSLRQLSVFYLTPLLWFQFRVLSQQASCRTSSSNIFVVFFNPFWRSLRGRRWNKTKTLSQNGSSTQNVNNLNNEKLGLHFWQTQRAKLPNNRYLFKYKEFFSTFYESTSSYRKDWVLDMSLGTDEKSYRASGYFRM